MKETYFSAAQLCKYSAAKIWYLRTHPHKSIVTQKAIDGTKSQIAASTSKYKELGGSVLVGGIRIFFSIDESKPNTNYIEFIEHKSVTPNSANWYLESAIVQTAVYAGLLKNVEELSTSKFYLNNGNPRLTLKFNNRNLKHILNFGGSRFSIKLKHPAKILKFIVQKANAALDYNTAIEWDKENKYQEYKILNNFFDCKPTP